MRKILFLFILTRLLSCQPQEKFDKAKWQQREDPAFPPNSRKAMLGDLQTNYKLIGMGYSELITLLGKPDFVDDSSMTYKVQEVYGTDIGPFTRRR